jgi:hypothetical protein
MNWRKEQRIGKRTQNKIIGEGKGKKRQVRRKEEDVAP